MSVHGQAKKVTTHTLQEMKRAGEKITLAGETITKSKMQELKLAQLPKLIMTTLLLHANYQNTPRTHEQL